jgi:integrase/recombinase XerD
MDNLVLASSVSPLSQHFIDDISMRRFSHETQRNYVRHVGRFAMFLVRSPQAATACLRCL